MNYYTSDLHFGHNNIIKFCERPWVNTDEMDQALIENWNARINENDHVYILGDFCVNKNLFIEILGKLKGFKHFVLGNHDPKGIMNAVKHLKNVFFHDLIHTVKDGNKKIVLCHYPIREWNGYYYGVVHFHGHTHGTIGDNFQDNAFDVGVDSRDYEPKLYEEIVADNFVRRSFGKGEYANKTNKSKGSV